MLYKKDKKGNILKWAISLFKWNHKCTISVYYGRLDGKMQEEQTDIIEGKAGRSIQQQAELQYDSLISKQKDKGYKSLEDLEYLVSRHEEGDILHTSKKEGSKKYGSLEEFLKANLPNDNTDALGRPKPMKCTALQDTKTNGIKESVFKKIKFPCIVQPKLDGVRCLILFDEQIQDWIAISSSGKSYDVAAAFILQEIRKKNLPKDVILDGELYIHGEPLEYLSGLARTQTFLEGHKRLEFHVFDILSKDYSAQRLIELNSLVMVYFKESKHIKLVPHSIGTDKLNLEATFCYYIEDGYEGMIIRNEQGLYKQGVRSSDIFKWKAFQDAEYEITGIELGKRGSEDMVFVLKTNEGIEFKAKPLGTRERKERYAANLPNLKGKKATIQFLTLSQGGIPQGNPRVKSIRDYE